MTLNFRTFLAGLVLLAMVVLCAHRAHAADATLNWTHPTTYTDGTPILLGALTQTAIVYGKCNAGQTGLLASPAPVTVTVAFPATSKVITGLGDGTWCFAARSETASAQSVLTGYVFKAIVLTPNPPTLSATVTLAYETWQFMNKTYLGRNVGKVAIGTPCTPGAVVTTAKATYYAVNPADVALKPGRTPKPGPIVTQCATV